MRHLSRLSAAASQWAPFFAVTDRQRRNSYHTNSTKSVWDFFLSLSPLHLASFALLSLVCLTSVFDPEAPLDRLKQCNEGYTHTSRTPARSTAIWIPDTLHRIFFVFFFWIWAFFRRIVRGWAKYTDIQRLVVICSGFFFSHNSNIHSVTNKKAILSQNSPLVYSRTMRGEK